MLIMAAKINTSIRRRPIVLWFIFSYYISGGLPLPDYFSGMLTAEVAATPLPAALPLFAGGLGALGLLGWRGKRKAAALVA